jgi:hypothetical protein
MSASQAIALARQDVRRSREWSGTSVTKANLPQRLPERSTGSPGLGERRHLGQGRLLPLRSSEMRSLPPPFDEVQVVLSVPAGSHDDPPCLVHGECLGRTTAAESW